MSLFRRQPCGGWSATPSTRSIAAAAAAKDVRSSQQERQALVESIEFKKAASSRPPAGKPTPEQHASAVLAEVCIEADASRRSPSVRAADELSDEEADAFFFV